MSEKEKTTGKKRNRSAYITDYKRKKYDRIVVEYPRGMRDKLKEEAAARGLSLQGMIKQAIQEYIEG